MMHDKLKKAFDSVTAEEALRRKTYDAILPFTDPQFAQIEADDSSEAISKNFAANKFKMGKIQHRRRRIIALAASFFLCFGILSFGGFRYYFSETAYISIDLNPSIELSLNPLDRVIGAKAYNEDGERILRAADTLHKNYEEALPLLLAEEEKADYLKKDSYLLITLQTAKEGKEQIMLDNLETIVSNCVKSEHPAMQTEIACTDEKTRQAAHHQKLSTGKYMEIQALQESNPEITFEDCAHLSMQEIREMYGTQSGTGGDHPHNRDGIPQSGGKGMKNGQGSGSGIRRHQENHEEN